MKLINTNARVYGKADQWSFSEMLTDMIGDIVDVEVGLQNDPLHGHHLIIIPKGFLNADYHFHDMRDVMSYMETVFDEETAAYFEFAINISPYTNFGGYKNSDLYTD